MCTTTEFNGESTHIYDTYNITVFLTKQSLCSCLSCFLDWKVLCHNCEGICDLLIHNFFNLLQFLRCYC